jgi:hypothetical protein
MEIAQDVARRFVESCIEHGDSLPLKVRAALKRSRRNDRWALLFPRTAFDPARN